MRATSKHQVSLLLVLIVGSLLGLGLASTGTKSPSSSRSSRPSLWDRLRLGGGNATATEDAASSDAIQDSKNQTNRTNRRRRRQEANNTHSDGGDDLIYDTKKSSKTKKDEKEANNNEKKSDQNTPETESSTQKLPPKPKRGRGPFGFFKPLPEKDGEAINATSTDNNAEETTATPTNVTAASDETSTNVPSDNSTVSQEPPSRVFIMGAPSASGPTAYMSTGRPPMMYGAGRPGVPNQAAIVQANQQALATAAFVSLFSQVTRLWFVVWVTKRLISEEETMLPVQHFVWESWNDRYSKDHAVLENVLTKTPWEFSKSKWKQYLRQTRAKAKEAFEEEQEAENVALLEQNTTSATATTTKTADSLSNSIKKRLNRNKPKLPSQTVVVVDLTPYGQLDLSYLTDVVNFLIATHSQQQLGHNPELVLLVTSPGGSVQSYGLATAQIRRLKDAGLEVTACVDVVAASGGYMIASQADTIIAAPFASLGSIGVYVGTLNFHEILTNCGVQPITLKAGTSKNQITQYSNVTEVDIEAEQERLKAVHQIFIDLCMKERPQLDASICDGSVVVGLEALDYGLVDRIMTSDQYLWEKMHPPPGQEGGGARILKLHRSSIRPSRHLFFARAMDLLPHLQAKLPPKQTLQKVFSTLIQGAAFWSMIQRSFLQQR